MKKSSALGFLFTFIFTTVLLIVGGYFLLRLVIIPKVVIPKICNEVKIQLGQRLTIKGLDINRKGTILIVQPILYARDSKDIMLECAQIKILPEYKIIFNSWKTNSNKPEIPLDIFIDGLKLKQDPVTLSGNIVSDFNLKLDLKDNSNIDWSGNIALEGINIQGIPTLGNIDAISGTIAVTRNSLVSYDIQGKVNNEAAKLEVLINDFKNPEIILQGELSPLKFNLNCALAGDNLSINELKASYNKIELNASGRITDLKNKANAQITADLGLELADLKNLPLEIKDDLNKINPQGLIKASIAVQGPLKDTTALTGSIYVECPKITLLDYEVNDIKIVSQLENGKAINSLDAMFLESSISAAADVNMRHPDLSFDGRIKIKDAKAARIQVKFMPDLAQKLDADISANIHAQGSIMDLSSIKIEADTIISNLIFDKFTFADPVEAGIDLIFKDLKDIIIKKFTLGDGIITLIVDGRITDINKPYGDLGAKLTTKLEKLGSYTFLNLPDNLILNGTLGLDLKVTGDLLNYQALNLPFKLSCPSLMINQFNLNELNGQGQFKQMKFDISTLSLKLYEGGLKAAASLDLADMQKSAFNLNAVLSEVDIQAVAQGTKLIPADFQGKFSTEIVIAGNGINPENLNADIKCTLDLENAKMNDIELNKVHANLDAKYNNSNLELKELMVLYKDIEVAAQGKVESVLKDPKININARSNIELADLDKLPFDFKKTLNELALEGTVNAKLQASGPLNQWQQMDINANITSEKMSLKKIQLNNVDISGDLSNSILHATANLNSYEGTLDLKADAEFSGESFKYKGTGKIDKVNIGALIEESKIIEQPHKGIFSLGAAFNGLGTDLNTIESAIDFQFEEGQISGLELLRSIGTILGLNFLSNFEVSQAKGTLALKNSIVHTEDTNIIGPDASISARGDINLNQSIDIIVKLILTPESAAQTSSQVLDKFFTLENEQYFTELEVKGTLTDPKPDLSKFIKERVSSQVKKEVQKQVFKAFEGLFR